MRIAYFVHDLTDPAVSKRVRMLKAGGAEIVVFGFRREDEAPQSIDGEKTVDFGRTHDGAFLQRAAMVARKRVVLNAWCGAARGADILMARNLEMLALAVAARRHCAPQARLIYECLDVHRLLLSDRSLGKALRAVERAWLARADMLVLSAPAFESAYFESRQGLHRGLNLPVLIVENKVLRLSPPYPAETPAIVELPQGPPWRIGWFGMIRCRKSFELLRELTLRRPDLLGVIMRGRPSEHIFANLDAELSDAPGIRFGGAYRPAELGDLYRGVHFNWAIDFFEAGGNSDWLLPNRIYEGGCYDACPIALGGTETGRWLKAHGIGVRLDSVAGLEDFLERMTPARFAELKWKSRAAPQRDFIADEQDCVRLVEQLAGKPRTSAL